MGGKWYTSKVSASEEANVQMCWWGKKKKTLWNITYILGKGKACFSSLASLKMLVTDGGVKNTGRITVWIHSRQLIDADLNGHGGWEVIERIFASPVIVGISRWLNYWQWFHPFLSFFCIIYCFSPNRKETYTVFLPILSNQLTSPNWSRKNVDEKFLGVLQWDLRGNLSDQRQARHRAARGQGQGSG